jgi:hypothetical protein
MISIGFLFSVFFTIIQYGSEKATEKEQEIVSFPGENPAKKQRCIGVNPLGMCRMGIGAVRQKV